MLLGLKFNGIGTCRRESRTGLGKGGSSTKLRECTANDEALHFAWGKWEGSGSRGKEAWKGARGSLTQSQMRTLTLQMGQSKEDNDEATV